MTFTSDGKALVYGVFGADGFECEFLEAIFGTEQKAIEHIAKLRADYDADVHSFYGKPELLTIKCLEIR